MNEFKRPLIVGDLVIQSLLYIPTVIASLLATVEREVLLLSLSIQFCLGVYQVLSGVVGALQGRRWKAWYLLVVLIYFVVWAFAYVILEPMRIAKDVEVLMVAGYVIAIPLIIGGIYYVQTFVDLRQLSTSNPKQKPVIFDEDILDAGI